MGIRSETEIRLYELQRKWRLCNDKVAYQEMFGLLVQYSRSMILKMTKGKKFLNPDYVFSKAVECTMVFLEQYEKNPEYMIEISFGGVLRYKVLEVLYGQKNRKDDRILSLNSIISNASSEKELEELQTTLSMKPFWSPSTEVEDPVLKLYHTEDLAIRTVISVVVDLKDTLGLSNRDMMILSIMFLQTFRKNTTLQKFRDSYLNSKLKEVYDLAMLEIRNRLIEEV